MTDLLDLEREAELADFTEPDAATIQERAAAATLDQQMSVAFAVWFALSQSGLDSLVQADRFATWCEGLGLDVEAALEFIDRRNAELG